MGARPTYRNMTHVIGQWLPTAALMLLCGCADEGRPAYRAGGTVSLSDRTPLPGGWIEFQLANDTTARTAKAKIQPDGRFELGTYAEADGALEGTHRVMLIPPLPPFVNPDGRPPPAPDDPRYPRINSRYRSFERSGLTFSVTSDVSKNRFEIRLED